MAVGLKATRAPPGRSRPRAAWAAVVAGVLLVHGCVAERVLDRIEQWRQESTVPARIQVRYVRLMAPAAPVAAAAPAAPAVPKAAHPRRAVVPVASRAASAPPEPAGPPVAPSEPERAAAVVPMASAAEAAAATDSAPQTVSALADEAASGAVSPAAAAASGVGPAFEWPVSTRMSFELSGNYRGPVHGSAQVEWVRVGAHYQVHLDVSVGPNLAPLITRQMSSDGDITPSGLAPRRFDQLTKIMFRDAHHATIAFEPDAVVLGDGARLATMPGVQDTASQIVQLSYVFGTRPEASRAGQRFDMPLALPGRLALWTYEVVGEERLDTSFGVFSGVHVRPLPGMQRPGELSAEIWFSPQLRYLPVRIRIQQDPQTYVDLLIDRLPQLAG